MSSSHVGTRTLAMVVPPPNRPQPRESRHAALFAPDHSRNLSRETVVLTTARYRPGIDPACAKGMFCAAQSCAGLLSFESLVLGNSNESNSPLAGLLRTFRWRRGAGSIKGRYRTKHEVSKLVANDQVQQRHDAIPVVFGGGATMAGVRVPRREEFELRPLVLGDGAYPQLRS